MYSKHNIMQFLEVHFLVYSHELCQELHYTHTHTHTNKHIMLNIITSIVSPVISAAYMLIVFIGYMQTVSLSMIRGSLFIAEASRLCLCTAMRLISVILGFVLGSPVVSRSRNTYVFIVHPSLGIVLPDIME